MSENKNLSATLQRIQKMKNERTNTSKGTEDRPKVEFFKPKKGRNNILLLPQPLTGDPFMDWGTHKNLLEPAFKDVVCLKHNFNESCLICDTVEDLKKANWKGNMHIWKPLELKVRYFSPIIDLDDVTKGLQYWSYGKSVLGQFETWLANLEEGETEFYNLENPEKIVVNYNPDAAAADMYKLDKKQMKPFSSSEIDRWSEGIKPLTEVFSFKPQDEYITELLEKYMERIQDTLNDASAHAEEGEVPAITQSTLDKLKK